MAQEAVQTALLQELKQKTEPADKQTVTGETDFAQYTRRLLEEVLLEMSALRSELRERH